MYPILFSIGQVNFYTHGLMIALGALAGGLTIYFLAKRENLLTRFLIDILIYSLFLGIIGARIVYLILYYYQFSNWHETFLIWYGGLVSFGGIATGFLAAGLILRKRGENVLRWFDLGIIGLLVGWSIGKIGCLLSGDIPGVLSFSKIAIWEQIPVSLFESIWALLLAAGLLYLLIWQKKWLLLYRDGFLFFIGIAGYLLGRFVIDFWRKEDIIILNLNLGQITSAISLIVILIFIYLYIFRWRK